MDPVGSIVSAIELTTLILGYVKNVHSAESERDDLLAEVSSLASILSILQHISSGHFEHENILLALEAPLQQCTIRLLGLEKQLGKGKKVNRWVWPFKRKEVAEDIETIGRLKSAITMVLTLNTMATVDAIRSDVGDVKANQQTSLKEQCRLDAIHFLGTNISRSTFEQNLEKRANGTGTWLMQHPLLVDWKDADNDTSKNVLWCPGAPGAGKSVASAIIIHSLQQEYRSHPSTAVIFAYFNYTHSTTYRAIEVIKDLLQQLLRCGQYSETCAKILEDAKASGGSLSTERLLNAFQCQVGAYSRVFVVLDALDEAEEHDRNVLLGWLLLLTSRLKLLCTSRDIAPLRAMLQLYPKLEIIALNADMSAFIATFIQGSKNLKKLLKPDDIPVFTETILAHSNGMFLLVALHLRSLDTKVRRRDLLSHLKSLTSDYTETYGKVMDAIRNQGADECQLAHQVLGWLFHSHRPMSLLELRYALAIDDSTGTLIDEEDLDCPEVLLAVTQGLVTIRSDSIVEYIHFTVNEFIESELGVKEHPHFPTTSYIANICLTYLGCDFSGQYLSDIPHPETIEEMWLCQYPFLHFAGASWDQHLRGVDQQSPIVERAAALLSNSSKRPLMAWCTFHGRDSIPRPHHTAPALHICSKLGLDNVVQCLLRQPGVLSSINDTYLGMAPIHYAAQRGHLSVLEQLSQADVEAGSTYSHSTPLMLAARAGHLPCVQHLLQICHANVESHVKGWTSLIQASLQGHLEVVKCLVEVGNANVDRATQPNGGTALMRAADRGDLRMVKYLVEIGKANIEARRLDGNTALLDASHKGHLDVVKYLVEIGKANIHVCDHHGRSTLMGREQGKVGYLDVIKYLLGCGAQVDARDNDGRTALMVWSSEGNAEIVATLVEIGKADLNIRDNCGKTALIHSTAWFLGSTATALACLLKTSGVDLELRDNENQWTALMWAAGEGNIAAVRLLLEAGADATPRDELGRDWTMLACRGQNVDLVKNVASNGTISLGSHEWVSLDLAEEDEKHQASVVTVAARLRATLC